MINCRYILLVNVISCGSHDPAQIGLLDIDICGPSIPKLMGLDREQVHQSGSGWSPVVGTTPPVMPSYVCNPTQYTDDNLGVMSVGFLLASPDDAVIWRGPKKNGKLCT